MIDCRFERNTTDLRGGAILMDGGTTAINCLFVENEAFQGGAIAIMVPFSTSYLYNCTFWGNHAEEVGGGIFDFGEDPWLYNCILWNNTPEEVWQSVPMVFCDVRGLTGEGVEGCFSDYPRFVGGFYLSHLATGQPVESPCVDTGGPRLDQLNPNHTTRIDGVPDTGTVDVGYHYPAGICLGDMDGDGHRDLTDFALFVTWYGTSVQDPAFDPHGDLDGDGSVDVADFLVFGDLYGVPCP
jgi:hypothetical protein